MLPEIFALDAERLARFAREAQTLASLNHPNIARGPTPLADALPIARLIAEAPVLLFGIVPTTDE